MKIGAIAKDHGDQLYSWFREKFKGHKDALTRRECRQSFQLAIDEELSLKHRKMVRG